MTVAENQLWIVEQFFGCDPKLEVWPLLRETKSSYTVKLRDVSRVFMKAATGRHYFTAEGDAVRYLRRCLARERDIAERTLRRLTILCAATDQVVIDFARRDEAVTDAVECEVHATESISGGP